MEIYYEYKLERLEIIKTSFLSQWISHKFCSFVQLNKRIHKLFKNKEAALACQLIKTCYSVMVTAGMWCWCQDRQNDQWKRVMTQRHPRALMQDSGDAIGQGGKRWPLRGSAAGSPYGRVESELCLPTHRRQVVWISRPRCERLPWKAARRTLESCWKDIFTTLGGT